MDWLKWSWRVLKEKVLLNGTSTWDLILHTQKLNDERFGLHSC